MKNIAVSFAISLDEKNDAVKFTSSIPSTLGNFTGDKIKLEEVFLNLLRNAHDAIGDEGRIQLLASRQKDKLTIAISDNGCGIPEQHLKSIFEPFKTYKPGGTGLGLSLSKRIIEAHNGTLTVSSTEGLGSTFSVVLPI